MPSDHWAPVHIDGELVALVRMGTTPATQLSVARMDGIAKTWPKGVLGCASAPLGKAEAPAEPGHCEHCRRPADDFWPLTACGTGYYDDDGCGWDYSVCIACRDLPEARAAARMAFDVHQCPQASPEGT